MPLHPERDVCCVRVQELLGISVMVLNLISVAKVEVINVQALCNFTALHKKLAPIVLF